MITKTALKKHLEKFPEKFTIDELVEKMIFIDKIEKRIQQSIENDVISENDLEIEINQWCK